MILCDVTVYRAVMGMLTVGNMMSMVTKGKVDVTDTVGKVIYRQFKQVSSSSLFCGPCLLWQTSSNQ